MPKSHKPEPSALEALTCSVDCLIPGSSEDSSSDGSTATVASCDISDAAALLGLSKKEMQRPGECIRLDDLSTRQMAMIVSSVTDTLPPSDVYECGGEVVPGLNSQVCSLLPMC